MVKRSASVILSLVASFQATPMHKIGYIQCGLGIEDEFQGQGLGRYLLQHALQEMHKVGYRHAAISSGLDNHRAFLFYNNCGYRVVD